MHFPVKLKFHCTLKLRLVIRLVGWIATPFRREILHTPVHIQVYKTSLQQSLHPGKQKKKVGGGRRLGPLIHTARVCAAVTRVEGVVARVCLHYIQALSLLASFSVISVR